MLSEVDAAACGPRRRKRGSPAITGARLTVLIADDDPVHRGLMEDLLTPLGFIVFKRSRRR